MINVKNAPYNAKGDGLTDDHSSIQQALNDAKREDKEVYIPSGIYIVSEHLNVTDCKVRGEHFGRAMEGGTIIKASNGFKNDEVILAFSGQCQVLDLFVEVNSMCKYGIHAFKSNESSTLFSNLSVANANCYGFYFKECQSTTVERLMAKNSPIGIFAEDCNATRFIHCQTNYNTGHGMIAKGNVASGGCRIANLISENNGGHGLLVENVGGVIIQNSWIENNKGDGVHLLDCNNGILESTRITGGDAAEDRCIRLINSRMCRVFNCSSAQSGYEDYLLIRDENGTENTLCDYNWRISDVIQEPLGVESV